MVRKTPTGGEEVFKSTANPILSLGFVDWFSLVAYVALPKKSVSLPRLSKHQN